MEGKGIQNTGTLPTLATPEKLGCHKPYETLTEVIKEEIKKKMSYFH